VSKVSTTVRSRVFRPWYRPTIVLPLVYCPVDNTLFDVNSEIRCSGVSSRYCCYGNHAAGSKLICKLFYHINWELNKVIRNKALPKIICKCCELVKLCHIYRSGRVFFLRHSVVDFNLCFFSDEYAYWHDCCMQDCATFDEKVIIVIYKFSTPSSIFIVWNVHLNWLTFPEGMQKKLTDFFGFYYRSQCTMADCWEVVYGLSNGDIFNDLEWLLTQISRVRHNSTLNVSETIQGRHITADHW